MVEIIRDTVNVSTYVEGVSVVKCTPYQLVSSLRFLKVNFS